MTNLEKAKKYLNIEEHPKAFPYLIKALNEKEYCAASYLIFLYYRTGLIVAKPNLKKAKYYASIFYNYISAKNEIDYTSDDYFCLGEAYSCGIEPFKEDAIKAIYCFEKNERTNGFKYYWILL